MLKATFTENFIFVSQFEQFGDFLSLIRRTIKSLKLFSAEVVAAAVAHLDS